MPMALKADVSRACRKAGMAKPVDLVHLSTLTMGDRDLEQQVLSIFLSQSEIYLKSWKLARDHDGRKRAAHSLKGASRGIGAWDLAELAGEAEAPAFADIAAVEAEVARVNAYIRSLVE